MSVNDDQEDITKEKFKKKIVVHINNYILANDEEETTIVNTTSNDFANQLRSLATPDSFFIESDAFYKGDGSDRLKIRRKSLSQNKNDCIIVHAKSLKFPIKIRPAYEIYPSSNLVEDKRHPWFNNKSFNNKLLF